MFSREFRLYDCKTRDGLEMIIPVLYGKAKELRLKDQYGFWRERDSLVLRCTEDFNNALLVGWREASHPLNQYVKNVYCVMRAAQR